MVNASSSGSGSSMTTEAAAVNVTSTDNSEEFVDYMDDGLLRAVFISAYSVVFVLGVAGNTLVVYVVARNRSMQTITNVFIANLAASDIMMCLLAVPFTPISGLLKAWPFGEALCRIVPMTLGVSVYVSTLTSTAIAVDRYFVIVHPFRPRMRVAACLILIGAIWLVSVSISLPLALYQTSVLVEGEEFYSCQESWPGPSTRHFFTLISFALQYIVPCLIIIYCYARVSVTLQRRARAKIGSSNNHIVVHHRRSSAACTGARNGNSTTDSSGVGTTGNSNADLRNRVKLRRKRRTNRMLMAMVAIFVVCWMPLNIILLTLEYYEELGEQSYFLLLFFVCHVIAVSSTVYNPFLYAWMNDNFRKEFRRVVPCLFSRRTSLCGSDRFFASTDAGAVVARGSPSLYSTVAGTDPTNGGQGHRRFSLLRFGRLAALNHTQHGEASPSTRRAVYHVDQEAVQLNDCGEWSPSPLPVVEERTFEGLKDENHVLH